MSTWLTTVLTMALVGAPDAKAAPAPGQGAEARATAEARGLVGELGKTLKGQLVAAMKTGGPVNAIPVCSAVAPGVSAAISERARGRVGRTSLRLRNPKNAPDAWERKVLEEFEAQVRAGADPIGLERSETVVEGGKKLFRYMKAIPAGQPCLACHGDSLAPEVQAKLKALYPADRATGFKLGDLRGAFTVVKPLP